MRKRSIYYTIETLLFEGETLISVSQFTQHIIEGRVFFFLGELTDARFF